MTWVEFSHELGYEICVIDDADGYDTAVLKMRERKIERLPVYAGEHYDSPDSFNTGEWLEVEL